MRIIWKDDQGIENKGEPVTAPLPSLPSVSSNNEPEPDNTVPEEYGEWMGDSEDA